MATTGMVPKVWPLTTSLTNSRRGEHRPFEFDPFGCGSPTLKATGSCHGQASAGMAWGLQEPSIGIDRDLFITRDLHTPKGFSRLASAASTKAT